MALLDLFRDKLNNSDPAVRADAVRRLPVDDERLYFGDGDQALRFFSEHISIGQSKTTVLEALAQLEERWKERGYRLVLVAVRTRQSRARLASFVRSKQPPGELLFDISGDAEKALLGEKVPTHVLLDAAGNEILRTEALDTRMRKAIERHLLAAEVRPDRKR